MWARIVTAQQTNVGRPQYGYAVITPRFHVEACCYEEHAWWVTAGPMFLSTWETRDEAEVECARLNSEQASLSSATK